MHMNINLIKVDTGTLAADARTVYDSIMRVEQMIDRLMSDYTTLDSMWEGPASTVYRTVFKQDIEELTAYVAELKKIHAYEEKAQKQYERCETEVNSLVCAVN